jgi:hypothetical protein
MPRRIGQPRHVDVLHQSNVDPVSCGAGCLHGSGSLYGPVARRGDTEQRVAIRATPWGMTSRSTLPFGDDIWLEEPIGDAY